MELSNKALTPTQKANILLTRCPCCTKPDMSIDKVRNCAVCLNCHETVRVIERNGVVLLLQSMADEPLLKPATEMKE